MSEWGDVDVGVEEDDDVVDGAKLGDKFVGDVFLAGTIGLVWFKRGGLLEIGGLSSPRGDILAGGSGGPILFDPPTSSIVYDGEEEEEEEETRPRSLNDDTDGGAVEGIGGGVVLSL
ncbi:hypothetical protein DFA_08611 [Cavenderia fasciculata]|uniref:Uncharacterized protein n=1 Tax=Cavenderia fasciculata TaxID=261658 RepID=F4Q3A5_CACFS|nr:uncharacterized protein DFA_08611 [Cavenderia fasciculata]EGG17615.1 hypothetical protein DFA_08611 [Cavenderia fasciculata]|eukprot:XP_004356099.1 hypothetical protein DFA_08611 [Cavenderia fasciculata]